jgi:hypothetical protein
MKATGGIVKGVGEARIMDSHIGISYGYVQGMTVMNLFAFLKLITIIIINS